VLLTAADDNGQGLTDEELWEDVHDVMGAGGGPEFPAAPFLSKWMLAAAPWAEA
jgi:hypothetical protein